MRPEFEWWEGRRLGQGVSLRLVLEYILPGTPSLNPPEALGIFIFFAWREGFLALFSLQFWLDFSPIPPASKEISLQGKIIPEVGKNTTSPNNFSLTFWVPVPVAFQKLVSVPLVLWCMVITASS